MDWVQSNARAVLPPVPKSCTDLFAHNFHRSSTHLARRDLLTPSSPPLQHPTAALCFVLWQDGYDHSYFFISSFIEDHVNLHADRLLA